MLSSTKKRPAAKADIFRLGNIVDQPISGASVVALDQPAREGQVGVLKLSAVADACLHPHENKRVPEHEKPNLRTPLRADTVLISRSNTPSLVGAVAYVGNDYPHLFLPDLLWELSVKDNSRHSCRWLAYLLSSPYFRNKIRARASGTSNSMKKLTKPALLAMPVPNPPKKVQDYIVATLACWDEVIQQQEQILSLKERRKRALMQQLLTGQRRICGNPTTPVTKSGIPSSWESPRARELFRSISIKNRAEEAVLSVTQDQGVVRRDSLDRKIEADVKNHSSYKLVEPRDFVISLRSFQGGLEYSNLRGVVSPAYHVIRATRKIDHDYFRYLFKSYWFIGHLATAVIGIRDGKQISFDDFGFMRLPYPPLEEQRCIASVLKTCDEEIGLLRELVEALKQQKKGLMQQLLTGQVRVPLVTKDGTHDS